MSNRESRKIVVIGGLDPSGHAGVLADSRVLQYYRIPHQIGLTAITAQSENKFFGSEPVSLPLFRKQLQSVENVECGMRHAEWGIQGSKLDNPKFHSAFRIPNSKFEGVKLGMLATPAHLKILVSWLKKVSPKYLLWDPVFFSSTGGKLFRGKLTPKLFQDLLKLVIVFTPNLLEAEFFLRRKITNLLDMEQAASELYRLGKNPHRMVLLKGGHLSKKYAPKSLTDVLVYQGQVIHLSHPRMKNRRGTGCTLGSAILANLVKGKKPLEAVRQGKKYLLTKHLHTPAF